MQHKYDLLKTTNRSFEDHWIKPTKVLAKLENDGLKFNANRSNF